MKVGCLCNPLSGRVSKSKNKVAAFRKKNPSILYQDVTTPADMDSSVDYFVNENIEFLIIIAGDGTVQMFLTSFLSRYHFANLPLLTIIPGGTTNMTACDLGMGGSVRRALNRLHTCLEQEPPHVQIKKHVLRIQKNDKTEVYGMFFGFGMIVDGVKYFHKHVKGTGVTGEKASSIVVFRYIFDLLLGRSSGTVNTTNMQLRINHGQEREESITIGLVSTLDRLLLGMRPYWGNQSGPVHTTIIRDKPGKLWFTLLPVLCGKGTFAHRDDGYYSEDIDVISMTMDNEYIVDGEIFDPAGSLEISAIGPINFTNLKNG